MNKQNEKNEFEKLMEIISGEKALKEKEEKLKEMKKQAKEDIKNKKRKEIVDRVVELEEDPAQTKKIVQNIKVFEWTADDRKQISFNDKGFLIVVVASLLFSLLLAILENYFLMASIMAMLFLLYIFGTTKPNKVTHKITSRGIDTGGFLYEWFMLDSFFFSKKDNTLFLVSETKLNIPKVIILLIDDKDKDALFMLLQERVLYKDVRKWNWLDRITYGEYIPLEEV